MIEYYISELLEEGIVHFPTWVESGASQPDSNQGDELDSLAKVSTAADSSELKVTIDPATPVSLHALRCSTSTMNLGASASNIACAEKGIWTPILL